MDLIYEEIKLKYPEKELHRAEDLSNKKFGEWTALYRTESQGRNTMWVCQCSCDNKTIKPVSTKSLKSGASQSCGCRLKKSISDSTDKKIHIRDDKNNIVKKKCFRCGRWLSLDWFYRSSYQKDGYSGDCKQCQMEAKECRYNLYKKNSNAKRKGFSLTKEEFYDITSKPCFYCGEYTKEDINGVPFVGVDRIDSNKGYEISNVVPCCEICNRMKLDYELNLFVKHVDKIHFHMKGENNCKNIFT